MSLPAPQEVTPITSTRHAEDVVQRAAQLARRLKAVISSSPDRYVQVIGSSEHLRYEAWATLARFCGVSAVIEWTRPILRDGQLWGYEARAIVVEAGDRNKVHSAAEAECTRDEPNWLERPKYEYHYVTTTGEITPERPPDDRIVWETRGDKKLPKRVRVRVSDEPVPQHQLRSMAQTRAAAKALRLLLSWIVVLEGYNPTPAEEMLTEARQDHAATQVPRKPAGTQQARASLPEPTRFWLAVGAAAKAAGENPVEWVRRRTGGETDIRKLPPEVVQKLYKEAQAAQNGSPTPPSPRLQAALATLRELWQSSGATEEEIAAQVRTVTHGRTARVSELSPDEAEQLVGIVRAAIADSYEAEVAK